MLLKCKLSFKAQASFGAVCPEIFKYGLLNLIDENQSYKDIDVEVSHISTELVKPIEPVTAENFIIILEVNSTILKDYRKTLLISKHSIE